MRVASKSLRGNYPNCRYTKQATLSRPLKPLQESSFLFVEANEYLIYKVTDDH